MKRPYEYLVVAGSRMYGTKVATSDTDYRGFFIQTKEEFFGLKPGSENETDTSNGKDDVLWEYRHFLNMCLGANPNCLEVLFAPERCVIHTGPIAAELRECRELFLSQRIVRTFGGYAYSNYKRVLHQQRNGQYDAKDAMHMLRLMLTATEYLSTGQFVVEHTAHLPYLMAVRTQAVPWVEIDKKFSELKDQMDALVGYNKSIPKNPDTKAVEDLFRTTMLKYYGVPQ